MLSRILWGDHNACTPPGGVRSAPKTRPAPLAIPAHRPLSKSRSQYTGHTVYLPPLHPGRADRDPLDQMSLR